MTDMTILQWIIIYLVGFFITLTVFKWIQKDERYFTNNEMLWVSAFSITWIVTLPIIIVMLLIGIVSKFAEWFFKQ